MSKSALLPETFKSNCQRARTINRVSVCFQSRFFAFKLNRLVCLRCSRKAACSNCAPNETTTAMSKDGEKLLIKNSCVLMKVQASACFLSKYPIYQSCRYFPPSSLPRFYPICEHAKIRTRWKFVAMCSRIAIFRYKLGSQTRTDSLAEETFEFHAGIKKAVGSDPFAVGTRNFIIKRNFSAEKLEEQRDVRTISFVRLKLQPLYIPVVIMRWKMPA